MVQTGTIRAAFARDAPLPALRLLAPAKINLVLEILGPRADAYHEVRTVLQAVSLCDELIFEPAAGLSLSVEPAGAAPMRDNLVLLAAERLRHQKDDTPGAAITLRKRIPMAAGLGGGSSDAAAALLGLSQLWDMRLSLAELAAIAADLGSDVPFFLGGGTALGEGRGERLSPLPGPVERSAVILTPREPDDGEKTKRLYGSLQPAHYSSGRLAGALVNRLHTGRPVADAMVNTFELVAAQAFPEYSAARAQLVQTGA
ncbi:MAG: 4-(cytidine 5'-diphospho)-2-C-methyl-D-erythritol kinase, partial [Dehalococcoidia bacterium]